MSFDTLELDLSGPCKAKRLSCLELLLKDGTIDSEVIEIALKVENVPATITDYRDRERHLESLLKALRKDEVLQSEKTQVIAFRGLLGSLYVNFEKFWGPTVRVIIDLLKQTRFQTKLLQTLVAHLADTNDIIYDSAKSNDLYSPEDRPDHILHRNFVLQLLSKFISYIESNSENFMNQFFRFVQHELLCSPFIEKVSRDSLEKTSNEYDEQLELYDIDCEDPEKEQNDQGFRGKLQHKQSQGRSSMPEIVLQKRKSRETFITITKLLSGFQNVNKIHRQHELKELVLELLSCRDSSVQKAAFNCLLAYDTDHIRPYADRLLKMINDKMVRSELTLFSIDENESDQVQNEHRDQLIPILMRILFGKMKGRIGKKTAGREKADLRKTLIMRFIAGCSMKEIMFFFQLMFDPYFDYLETPYSQLESVLERDLKINHYCPLNKLHAMLDSLSAYMESVAHLKDESLSHVLKMINIIVFHVITPLDNPKLYSQISEKNIALLKALRRECVNIIAEFFRMFEYYPFKQEEINFIFKYLIWNSTQGFIDRNYAHPTPLLKLIGSFAGNRVYLQLLVKRNKFNPQEYLLRHIIDLYTHSKTQRSTLKFVASMLADIIYPDRHYTQDSDDPDLEIPKSVMLQDEDCLIPEFSRANYKIPDQLEFNYEILIAYIPPIFNRLKKTCQEFIDKKDTESKIGNEELLILSSLSQYLMDSEQSLLGARLLLLSLPQQKKADLILLTLRTVKTLMRQVRGKTDPVITDLVANILSYQRNVEQRRELCELIELIAEIDENLADASQAICLMNKMSGDFIDSPDLVMWNEGFQVAFRYLEKLDDARINQPKVVRDSLVLLLHQTCFIINSIDRYEFSIRGNCTIFYEKLAETLKHIDSESNRALLDLLIEDIMLEKFIKRGLRESNDAIKHTYIGILRTLAIHCHEKKRILGEFYLFCNDNQDTDFWLNIRHIQLHNRSKALARIIASGFLFSKTYKSVASLSENSIKLIGIICRQLNWKTYESTLSYYLDLLTKANATYQRTNIKLITEILKNFNYDMSSCEEAMQFEDENSKLEKRMRKRIGDKDDDSQAIATDAPSGKRLNPSTARMVYHSVSNKLIPRLNNCLHEMTRVEFEHDKNMADYLPEKEEIKRIPIAYAIVQLLNLLPGRYVLFRDQLPPLFLKLSSFLKSKNDQVRKVARLTLNRIMNFVGPAYMPDLLRTLKQNLDKGFQVHVLNYTVHSILDKMSLQYGDLDVSAHELVNLAFQEIFGKISEDKEVAQILAKTFEAKKTKSYDTLLILSTHISAEKLDYLMNSIKETLKTSSDLKKVNKLSLCIQKIFNGLAKNVQFPLDKLFNFIRETIEESIPSLKVAQRVDQAERPESSKPLKEDRYLIIKDLPRDRIKSKINEKGNFHMIIENCLRLLLHTFETNKIIIKRRETIQKKLDGFIELLSTCLKSSSPRCVMRSLKCIYFIAQTKIDLPSFKTKCNSMIKKIFVLLSLYNGVGMVQGDNFEMIGMCFKTITLLLLRCEHVQLKDAQVRALLTYIEQDLHDTARQATAFGTLNSLLHRKFDSPELVDIMIKVANLLVTSEDETVRDLSVKIWQTYLLEYKHDGLQLNKHLTRFLRQLDYEYIDGRKSVLNVLNVIVTKFPEKLLRDYQELMFNLLALRLVNEESKEVRGIVGRLIGLLAQRLPDLQLHTFNKFIIPWASGANTELKLLGIKLISVYVESCESILTRDQMKRVLSLLSEALHQKNQGADVRDDVHTESNDDENETLEKDGNEELVKEDEGDEVKLISDEDKLDYHALRLFKRLLDKNLLNPTEIRFIEDLKKIWHNIATTKLTHWYIPVVITSCELYLMFIRKVNLSKAIDAENPSTDDYLEWNAKRILRTLCDKFIDLLDRVDESNQLIGYITEGLILLGQLVANSKSTIIFEQEYTNSFNQEDVLKHFLSLDDLPNDGFIHDRLPCNVSDAKKHVNLMWLSVKVVMQARKEAALYRLSKSYRRQFVLRWTAAISQELGARRVIPYLLLFTMTPVRELTDRGKGKLSDDSSNQNILVLCEDLLKFIKSLIGVENFNKIYSKVQLHFTKRRIDRKKKEALIRVKDQARGVKRKMKKLKNKDTKRRKIKTDSRNARKGVSNRSKRR